MKKIIDSQFFFSKGMILHKYIAILYIKTSGTIRIVFYMILYASLLHNIETNHSDNIFAILQVLAGRSECLEVQYGYHASHLSKVGSLPGHGLVVISGWPFHFLGVLDETAAGTETHHDAVA